LNARRGVADAVIERAAREMTGAKTKTMASPTDQVIEELAAGQHGLVTRAQLLKRGLTIDTVAARV
jgi:hypothetical protein